MTPSTPRSSSREFYAGGDRYVLSAIPFDPAEKLAEELRRREAGRRADRLVSSGPLTACRGRKDGAPCGSSASARGSELPGALVSGSVLPLPPVMASLGLDPAGTIRSVLPFLGPLCEAIGAAAARGDELIPLDQTRLGPPVTDPPNLFACGANYCLAPVRARPGHARNPHPAGHVPQAPVRAVRPR